MKHSTHQTLELSDVYILGDRLQERKEPSDPHGSNGVSGPPARLTAEQDAQHSTALQQSNQNNNSSSDSGETQLSILPPPAQI